MSIKEKDWRDIIAGGLMLAFGLFCAIYAQQHYRLGTPTRMGPGWFPMYLGWGLAIIGVFIMLPAFFRSGEPIVINWRSLGIITLGVLSFAWLLKFVGLVPAVMVQIGISVLADDKLGIKGTLILAACTAAAAYVIFNLGLGLNLEPFIWPFSE